MKKKFIRVAQEGKTIDGREITRTQIEQMATNYNPKTYNARIWCEHMRSLLPDGMFKALGDVVALKTERVKMGKCMLLAQLNPTPELIKMNQERQKIHCSIEMDTQFTDTNEAYLVGLAVTDSPASLGTEVMKFSQQHAAEIRGGNKIPQTYFSDYLEVDFDKLNDTHDTQTSSQDNEGLFVKVKNLFAKKDRIDATRLHDIEQSILTLAEKSVEYEKTLTEFTQLQSGHKQTQQKLSQVQTQLEEIHQFNSQADLSQSVRPLSTGTQILAVSFKVILFKLIENDNKKVFYGKRNTSVI